MSFVEMGAAKAFLYLQANISICTWNIYRALWVKFSIKVMYVMLFSILMSFMKLAMGRAILFLGA
jgi:hypothetical protein